MDEKVSCKPSAIRLVSRAPIPESIIQAASKITGLQVSWSSSPICNPGEIVITAPNQYYGVPSGDCLFIEFPHLNMILFLLAEASNDWCSFVEDPESFYYKVSIKIADGIRRNFEPAWKGPPRIPKTPPPLLIASEIYVDENLDNSVRLAGYRVNEGAEVLVISPRRHLTSLAYLRTVKKIADEYNVDVFVDPGGLISPEDAYSAGSTGWMSLTPCELDSVEESIRKELAFVIIPGRLGPPESRVNLLTEASRRARELGYKKIIYDPVLQPLVFPGLLAGLISAYKLRSMGYTPIMLGINNVYELIDADTTGSIPVLMAIAGEAGASVVLITEESYKSGGATLEARISSELVSLALASNTPPKDYPFRLLVAKAKGRDLIKFFKNF